MCGRYVGMCGGMSMGVGDVCGHVGLNIVGLNIVGVNTVGLNIGGACR